jgi:hypothetical protein
MADTTSNQGPTTTLGNFLFTANNPQNTGISDVLSNMSDMQKLNGQFAVNKAIATAGYKKDSKGNLIKYSLDTSGNPVIDPNGQPIIDYGAISDSLNKQGFGNLIDPTLQALSNARITNSTNQAALNQILAGQKAAGIAVGQGTAFKPTIATPSTPAGTPSYTPPASNDNSTPASSNAPTNAPTPSGIDLSKYSDGDLMILSRKDPATYKAIQAQIGTTVDGKFGNNTLKAFRQAKAQNMTPTPANIAAAYGSNSGDNANGQVQPGNTVQVTPPASSDNSGTFTLPDISTSAPSSAPAPLAMGSQVGFGGVAPGTFQGSYPTPSQNIPKSLPGTTFDAGALNDSDKLNVVRKLSQNGVAPKSLSTNDIQNAVEQFANKGVSDIPAPILKNNFETDPQKRADIDSQNAKAIADYNAQISTVRTKNLQALGLATSEQQSQKSQAQGIAGQENQLQSYFTNKKVATDEATKWGTDAAKFGTLGSAESVANSNNVEKLTSSQIALKNQAQVTSTFLNNFDPTNARQQQELNQQVASFLRSVQQVAGATGTEADLGRSLKESGLPESVYNATSPTEALKTYILNNPKESARLVVNVPSIIKKNVVIPFYNSYGIKDNNIIDKNLGDVTKKIGDIKVFPNGKKGKWNGSAWEQQ